MDSRIEVLAAGLVNYSCGVKAGDKVYIHYIGKDTKELARQLVKEVYRAGGVPFIHFTDPQLQREQLLHATKEQMELMAEVDALEMSKWTATSAFAAAITYRNCRMCRPSA